MAKYYGIPYMGSKEKILALIDHIFLMNGDKEYFIDPFCGGFCVSAYALKNTKFKVLANDPNKYVISLYKEILFNGSKEFNKVCLDWVSRKKFKDVKDNPDKYPDWYVGYVVTIWSFANGQSAYLFSKENECDKQKLHQALVFNEWHKDLQWLKEIMPQLPKEYSPVKRLKFMGVYKKAIKYKAQLQQLQQLERLQQLEQLQRLERLQQLERLERLERLEAMDWYDFIQSIPEEILNKSFIYCDPPYEGTEKYAVSGMNYGKFWEWFVNYPYPIYVSSYSAPEGIKPIETTKKIVLFSSASRKTVAENIYYNGKGIWQRVELWD